MFIFLTWHFVDILFVIYISYLYSNAEARRFVRSVSKDEGTSKQSSGDYMSLSKLTSTVSRYLTIFGSCFACCNTNNYSIGNTKVLIILLARWIVPLIRVAVQHLVVNREITLSIQPVFSQVMQHSPMSSRIPPSLRRVLGQSYLLEQG